jgi:hypothetical protein
MSQSATVLWIPEPTMTAVRLGRPIFQRGKDRQFESLENAVRFVMEDLSAGDRPTAMIQTDDASIPFRDIARLHKGARGAGLQ